jgi:hypothetical protein
MAMRRTWLIAVVAGTALVLPASANAAVWLRWQDASLRGGALVRAFTATSDGAENGLLGRAGSGRPTRIRVYLQVPGRRYDLDDLTGSVRRGALVEVGALRNDQGVGRLVARLPALPAGRYRPIVDCRPCGGVFVGGPALEVR